MKKTRLTAILMAILLVFAAFSQCLVFAAETGGAEVEQEGEAQVAEDEEEELTDDAFLEGSSQQEITGESEGNEGDFAGGASGQGDLVSDGSVLNAGGTGENMDSITEDGSGDETAQDGASAPETSDAGTEEETDLDGAGTEEETDLGGAGTEAGIELDSAGTEVGTDLDSADIEGEIDLDGAGTEAGADLDGDGIEAETDEDSAGLEAETDTDSAGMEAELEGTENAGLGESYDPFESDDGMTAEPQEEDFASSEAAGAGQGASPVIALTYVPAYGVDEMLEGRVFMEDGSSFDPSDYRISLFIQITEDGAYWPKPYYDNTVTEINQDGTFSGLFCTGGEDEKARIIHVFLIPSNYVPADFSETMGKAVDNVKAVRTENGSVTITPNRAEKASQIITVKISSTSIAAGKTAKITVSGAKGKVSYKSSDSTIAAVSSSGIVTARKAGTVKITVEAAETEGYKSASASVAIRVTAAETKLTVKSSAPSVAVGKTAKITVSGAKGKVSYKSSDSTIAAVSSSGTVTAKKVGTAKITVKSAGTESYKAASASITIKVVPAATTQLTAKNVASGISLSWKQVTGATGYRVYRDSALIATVSGGSTVNYTDKKATANGKKYTYKVVARAATGDSTLSRSRIFYRLTRPAKPTLKVESASSLSVKWAKNAKGTGYQIQYSPNKKFSEGVKTLTVSGAANVSKKISGLVSGKTYYVRVRTQKKVDGRTYSSAWGAAKGIKTKEEPVIAITYVPPYGDYLEDLEGQVFMEDGSAFNPSDYRISLFIQLGDGGTYWPKPTYATPYTDIDQDGTFTGDFTTGGYDAYAELIHVMLIPSGYVPDDFDETYEKAIDYVKITRKENGSYTVSPRRSAKGKIAVVSADLSKTSISSAANSASKKMTVKWSKNKKGNGYQIQYDTSEKFSANPKTVTVSGASTTSSTIGGLVPGSTYYVRLRTLKTKNGRTYVSAWSKTKSVKISK